MNVSQETSLLKAIGKRGGLSGTLATDSLHISTEISKSEITLWVQSSPDTLIPVLLS